MSEIILASSSPRRKELMALLPFSFDIISEAVNEEMDSNLTPQENVMRLAYEKAKVIAHQYADRVVIGCDTIVVLDNEIMGKPKSKEDAKRMLNALSNREHNVYTGISILNIKEDISIGFNEMTKVKIRYLKEEEINSYIATGEPLDKAGAYGIQGLGAIYIEKIKGDYYNVMGLPLCRLYQELVKIKKV